MIGWDSQKQVLRPPVRGLPTSQPLSIRGQVWDGRWDFDFHRAVRCGYASELVGVPMQFVRIQPWYLTSIALGLTAIAVDTASKRAAAAGMTAMAKATAAKADSVREAMMEQAAASVDQSGTLGLIGLCVAAGSAICLFLSIHNNELGWHSVPVVILISYVLWLFVLV